MDGRLRAVTVVAEFGASLQSTVDVRGLYVGGSLASGDYHPVSSDLDIVAVVGREVDPKDERRLRDLHRSLRATAPSAHQLHCAYVGVQGVADVTRRHPTWTHARFYRRAVSGVARAELQQFGITVVGPPPAALFPPVDLPALRRAVIAELTGPWAETVRRPWLWMDDLYVDLGLLSLARAEVALSGGRLITKTEALTRLARFGVDPQLAREISRRREGEVVSLTPMDRVRRARHARQIMINGIRRLVPTPSD